MQNLTIAKSLITQIQVNLWLRGDGSKTIKEFSECLNVDKELIKQLAKIEISNEIMLEAAKSVPNPTVDPLIDESNRSEFLKSIISIANSIKH